MKSFVSLFLVLILLSCSKQSEQKKFIDLTIEIPQFNQAVSTANNSLLQVTEPATVADINCFGVGVHIPSEFNPEFCPLDNGTAYAFVSRGGLAFRSGNTVTVQVENIPENRGADLHIFGFKANAAGDCPDFSPESGNDPNTLQPGSTNLSFGYFFHMQPFFSAPDSNVTVNLVSSTPIDTGKKMKPECMFNNHGPGNGGGGGTPNVCDGFAGVNHKDIGTGVFNDPYIICNALQLKSLAESNTAGDFQLGMHYALGADIDLSAAIFHNLSIGSSGAHLFAGNFDARDFTIDNYTLNTVGVSSGKSGLFQTLSGLVDHLKMENVNIDFAGAASGPSVGALAGTVEVGAHIRHVSVSSSVPFQQSGTGYDGSIGGLVGEVKVTTAGNVLIEDTMAALIIDNDSTASGVATGGLIGKIDISGSGASAVDIKNSFTTGGGNISIVETYAGGLIGKASLSATSSTLTIDDCYSTLGVTAAGGTTGEFAKVGGFIGEMGYVNGTLASINRSYATGVVTNSNDESGSVVGGFIGYLNGSANIQIRDSLSTGAVVGASASNVTGGRFAGGNGGPSGNIGSTNYYFMTSNCTGCTFTASEGSHSTLGDFYIVTNPPYTSWSFGPTVPWTAVSGNYPDLTWSTF